MLQCFEWSLLATMIKFQSQYKVSELNVLREDFNKTEAKKVRATGYIIWLNILFFVAKVSVPCITLITCSVNVDKTNCNWLADKRVNLLLIFDITYQSALLMYIIFCSFRLIYFSWKYSRLEAQNHLNFFLVNTLGLLSGQLLVLNNFAAFYDVPNFYKDWRFAYYFDWVASYWPAMIYLLTKKSTDWFGSFNRLAPQTYSLL